MQRESIHDARVSVREKTDETTYPATFEALLEYYQAEREPSPDTLRDYRAVVRQFVGYTQSNRLDTITRDQIAAWRTYLRDTRQLAPASINSYLRHLRALLRFADLYGYHSDIVLNGIKTVQTVKPTKKTLERVAIREVLQWLQDPAQSNLPGWFWEAVVKTFYYTGMRRRQLVGLTWGDIDTKQQTILLRGEHSKTKREWKIPLPSQLIPVLADLRKLAENKLERSCRRADQVFNATLFRAAYKGNRMTVEQLSEALKRISRGSGVLISSHRFRHTFATQLAKEGNLRDLQKMLGHTNLSTTMEYVEPSVNQMRTMLGAIHDL